ncbi:hypothetical protein [Dawidia soli]|uniref:Uncharacterized protein n=1 Tax=Dawidia soli TaxID=2782352 RepID=A0AAP2GJV1_9BACT|nr:hypothetical protein [Dawidia soli]MBT1688895.1 hypothetical protein [Dawidia soli]
MNPEISFILVACFGASCQEIIHWFELRKKLDTENRKVLKSKFYWLITFLMISISGVGTWLFFYDQGNPMGKNVQMVLGAAFPALFKKAVDAFQRRDLGGYASKRSFSLHDVSKFYFK